MKSFDACFENEELNRAGGIFFLEGGGGVTYFLFYSLDLVLTLCLIRWLG